MSDLIYSYEIYDTLPMQIAILDRQGVIQYTNSAWDAFATENGYQGGMFKGTNYADLCLSVEGVEKDQAKSFAMGLKEVLAGRKDKFEQVYPCHAPDCKRWFKGIACQKGSSVLVMHVDITDQYEEYNDLSMMLNRVETIHDLRTPLTAILGFAELGQALKADKLDVMHTYFGHIHSSGLRLLELVNGILETARGEAKKELIADQKILLEPFLRSIINETSVLGQSAEVDVQLKASPGLTMIGNEMGLWQVFTNLIGNAIKFNRKGGRVRVEGGLNEANGIVVRVIDNGYGISTEQVASIFKPFHRVLDQDNEEREGTGLGLAICKDIVNQHEGQLTVDSTPGEGSIFTVTLPSWRTA